ncbi:sigma-70 RNA polymerase sigma factor region 4 domain-containing protein [Granulicatella seriolae]|jgi:DNA-directed RNA polymerase specialized sigma24 family protein|uniref:Sigma-70 family RNA polymerase sigma factor n=1 Tax=Granulicatella seriolae TaxID=2967226 RepID=A0ABT1WKU8_9LACT|nr:hypothetical protein [Granulicatella seriolae]
MKKDVYSAQLTSYFVRVIRNRAAQYNYKKIREQNLEILIDDTSREFIDPVSMNDTFEIPNIVIFNIKLYIKDEKLRQVLEELNDKEKFILINKVIFDQTDEELSQKLGVGRPAVTNFKNRMYKRIIKNWKKHYFN